MAKQSDLKKVELKVSVDCCDGCKRKTRKVLRSIDGVFSTEIDPLQPKVTVVGNVDPQVLIKKLSKAGKQAQVWSQLRNQNEKAKCQDSQSSGIAIHQSSKSTNTSNPPTDQNILTTESTAVPPLPTQAETAYQHQLNCSPPPPAYQKTLPADAMALNFRNHTPQCFFVGPNSTSIDPMPYHCMPSSYAEAEAPLLVIPKAAWNGMLQTYPSERAALCETPLSFQTPAPPALRVMDYFSEDNTVGCHLM